MRFVVGKLPLVILITQTTTRWCCFILIFPSYFSFQVSKAEKFMKWLPQLPWLWSVSPNHKLCKTTKVGNILFQNKYKRQDTTPQSQNSKRLIVSQRITWLNSISVNNGDFVVLFYFFHLKITTLDFYLTFYRCVHRQSSTWPRLICR